MFTRRVTRYALVLSLVLTTLGALAQPAQAGSAFGCAYPRVCFYLTQDDWDRRVPTASFKDAGYWQNLGSRSAGSDYVYNSRNDDGAVIRYISPDGLSRATCMLPSEWGQFWTVYPYQIKIVDSPTCAGEV